MKKIIDKEKCTIIYLGKVEELKNQLKYLTGIHPQFKLMSNEENFKKFPFQEFPFQTMNERLIYDKEKIIYGSNGSAQDYKFLNIKHYSDLADKKFIKKHGKKNLEIILV
jgi:hypothetical protein